MDRSIKSLLQKVPIFAGLSEDVIAAFAKSGRPEDVDAGTVVVRQGTPGHEMFIVVEGEVEVVRERRSSRQVRLASLGVGEFFGEMCIIQCMPRCATVTAVKPSLLFVLTNSDILGLFHKNPQQFSILILNIARDLCRRLEKLEEL